LVVKSNEDVILGHPETIEREEAEEVGVIVARKKKKKKKKQTQGSFRAKKIDYL